MTTGSSADIEQAIERRLTELTEQLQQHDALVAERDRLQGWLQELRQTGGSQSERKPSARKAPARKPSGRRTRAGARGKSAKSRASTRRPRGQNRQAVVEFLGTAGEANAAAIADATGIARSVIYNLLGRLADDGTIQRRERDGQAVYALPS